MYCIYVLVRRQWTNGGGCGGLGETAAGKDMDEVGGLSFSVLSVLVMLDHTKFSMGMWNGYVFLGQNTRHFRIHIGPILEHNHCPSSSPPRAISPPSSAVHPSSPSSISIAFPSTSLDRNGLCSRTDGLLLEIFSVQQTLTHAAPKM